MTLAYFGVAMGVGLPDPQPAFQVKESKRQAVVLKTYDVLAGSTE